MKLHIQVTQDNIDKARPSTKCACPIALAVKDELIANHEFSNKEGSSWASIDNDKGRAVEHRRDRLKFNLPESAQQFIRERDEKKAVKPFEFTVEAKAV